MSVQAYTKRWRLDRAQGVSHSYVSTSAVQEHILGLLEQGASRTGVARVAGVSPQTICRLLRQPRCQRGRARLILAVSIEQVLRREDSDGFVPAIGTRRRIRALLALGHRHTDITAHMPGLHRSAVILHQSGAWVTRQTYDAVLAAYAALSMTRGPSEATRQRSAHLGHYPPLAWDDETIDDPAALPYDLVETNDAVDHVAVERALSGDRTTLTRAERWIAVERLAAQGLSDRAIGQRVGVSDKTVFLDRQALGLDSQWKAAS